MSSHAEGIDLTTIIEATAAAAFQDATAEAGLPGVAEWKDVPALTKLAIRESLLETTQALLPHLAPALKATAWDEGFAAAMNQMLGEGDGDTNPYKEEPCGN